MGADIYLESISNIARNKYEPLFRDACTKRDLARNLGNKVKEEELQKRVEEYHEAMYPEEGYFRDSYNGSTLLWVINLSWWEHVVPMLDKTGHLPIKRAIDFLAMIKERPVTLERVRQVHAEEKLGDTPEEWYAHWVEKRKRLIKMLKRSIRLKEPLLCSL